MPKINPEFLDTVFYLYSNHADAVKGSKSGGTGFFVGYPSKTVPHLHHVYAVSNFHVVHTGANFFVRAHTKDEKVVVIETEPEDWVYVPGGNDVTVTSFDLNKHSVRYRHIPTRLFLERGNTDVGIGDEVMMVGRFVDHDGGERNAPAARFGAISMMNQPIMDDLNLPRDSFCVDMHSRSGFSGSPVLVYRTPGRDLTDTTAFTPQWMLRLLGIHWGQFKETLRLQGGKVIVTEGVAIERDATVNGLSGMTCVAPAWDILETLEMEELVKEREASDKKWAKK